ncbi:MAG: hypothetical protein MI757_17945 [Pirellulales bacterium]|nr:hypothetical protein [Pirellulales bacterium]
MVSSVYADGEDLLVDYEITGQAVSAFDVDITRAADGVNDDAVLQSVRVSDSADLSVGSHTLTIAPDFADVQENYWLNARVDAGNEIAETDETNNSGTFTDGAFHAADGVVHVHGSNSIDTISIVQWSKFTLNGNLTDYLDSGATRFHVRTHGGADDVTVGSGLGLPHSRRSGVQ